MCVSVMLVAAQINGTNFKTSKPISKSVVNGIDFGFAIILQMLLFLLLLLLLLMSIHMISMDAKAKISSLMQLIFWTHFMLKLRNKWCLKNRNVKVKMKMKICNRLQSLWRVNTFPKVWHNDYFTTYVFGIDLFWVLANPNYSSHGISIRLDEITSSIVASLCRRSRVVQSNINAVDLLLNRKLMKRSNKNIPSHFMLEQCLKSNPNTSSYTLPTLRNVATKSSACNVENTHSPHIHKSNHSIYDYL